MTQLFRAAAPFVVLGRIAVTRRTKPVPHHRTLRHLPRRFASTALLGLGVLAGCADQITSAAPMGVLGPSLTTAPASTQQYVVPYHPNSATDGSDDFPWTQSSVTVPRAGRYRLRVQGSITMTVNPVFPNVCGGNVGIPSSGPTGAYGPMGKRTDFGDMMQVRVHTGQLPYSRYNQGFIFTTVDAQTMEAVVTLPAGASLWTMFSGYTSWTWCGEYYPHYLFEGTHTLTVTELAGATLECKGPNGETTVERGQTVRCVLRSENAFRVLTRRATGEGFTISETPGTSHAAGTEHVWEGPAVASTEVQMLIETSEEGGPKQTTHSAAFTVRARDWPKLQLAAPVVEVRLGRSLPVYPAANRALGSALAFLPRETWNALPVTRSTEGPNAGLSFLTSPLPTVSHSIYIHPGLYRTPATPEPPHQQWYLDQDGDGEGDCTSSVFPVLRREINRHEGSTQATQSHWGVASRYYHSSEAEQRFEEVYRNGTEEELRVQARSVWSTLHGTGSEYRRLQDAFDAVDRPKVNDLLGCLLDYTPGD
jgi:hypothetical protein